MDYPRKLSHRRQPIMRRIVLSTFMLFALALTLGIMPTTTAHAEASSSNTRLTKGTWILLAPNLSHAASLPSVIGGGGRGSCPSNSTGYTGSLAPYNCHEVLYDGDVHGVWVRNGSINTFGIAHFQTHNLELRVVEDVILFSQDGIRQSNGRYLYGAYYANPDGGIDQFVQVFEDRGLPNAPGVNDGHELGVVTAYCEDEYGNVEQLCPDWVNQTL